METTPSKLSVSVLIKLARELSGEVFPVLDALLLGRDVKSCSLSSFKRGSYPTSVAQVTLQPPEDSQKLQVSSEWLEGSDL